MQQLDIMAPSLKVLGHKREREEKLCVGCRVAKDFPGRKKSFSIIDWSLHMMMKKIRRVSSEVISTAFDNA